MRRWSGNSGRSRRAMGAVGAMLCILPPLVLATDAEAVTPTLSSQASQPDPSDPRTPLFDTATLAGAVNPSGIIQFHIFGPSDPTCSGTPYATSTPFGVFGNGTFTSDPVVAFGAGTYRWVVSYSGDGNNDPLTTACGDPAETVDVPRVLSEFSTQASGSVSVGNAITDTASLSAVGNPTGSITFDLFGPDDATCSGPPIFVAPPVTVNGSGNYTSAPFVATIPGTYRWVSTYSGDAEITGGTSGCNTPAESVVVTPPTPLVLTTQVSESGPGAPLVDNATLSGGVDPRTGTITFELYGPGDPLCAGPPIFTSPGLPLLPGYYVSNGYFPVDPGTYRWVASYSGDANNPPVGPTACGDPAETVEVLPPVSLTTQASGSVEVGGTLTDTATFESDPSATGVIVFGLFGPDDPTCSAEPIAVSFAPVAGPGSYTSDPFTVTAPGTYHWVTQYSGDANHPEIGPTGCADPAETVVVTAPPPSPRGFLTICKARSNGATGNYVFTVDGRSFTVAAGQCSPSIRLLAGETTVTEAPTVGFKLARCATAPADRLVACNRNAGSAVVRVRPGGVTKQTVVTFTNKAATGDLKVCKVAGNGVVPGSRHVFQVNGRPVVVKAGSGPGGGCVAAGSFPVGTHVDVDERVKPTERVSAIAVRPASRLVGTPDLDAGKVTIAIDSGVTEVRFTDVVR